MATTKKKTKTSAKKDYLASSNGAKAKGAKNSQSSRAAKSSKNSKNSKSSKSSNSGKKSQAKARAGRKQETTKKAQNAKKTQGINGEILAIITLVFGVFFAVAMHTDLTGFVGDFLGTFFRGMFGLTGYFIPYAMICASAMVFMKHEKPFTKKHIICICIIFFMVNLINAERFMSNFSLDTADVAVVYSMGNQLVGGGVLGMYPGKVLENAIGPVGIYLFSGAMILICCLIASDVTLASIFEMVGEHQEQLKEERAVKKEEKMLMRLEAQEAEESYQQNFFEKMEPADAKKPAEKSSSKKNDEKLQNMKNKLEVNRRRNNILSLVKSEKIHDDEALKNLSGPVTGNKSADKLETMTSPISTNKGATAETVEIPMESIKAAEVKIPRQQKLNINIDGVDYNEPIGEDFTIEDAMVMSGMKPASTSKAENPEKDALNRLEAQNEKDSTYEPVRNVHRKGETDANRKEREKSEIEIKANIENQKDQEMQQKIEYKLPKLDLLNKPQQKEKSEQDLVDLRDNAKTLEKTLKSFNVDAKVINVTKGSSVTRYEVQPAVGTKVSSIVRLSDDIALNLRAKSIRMEAPIPGKAAVGIEIENEDREMVTIGEMIGSEEFKTAKSKLSFVVGKDIAGKTVVADLAKMPHMLIAGATGSGKSVCINSIIASILYNAKPSEVKLLLIDPKMVELGNYNGIPHLLIPVVTDSNKAAAALNWAVSEMTGRYKKFAENSVREMKSYNKLMEKQGKPEEVMTQIVIIIDELADLMMVASSLVEEAICRLAQLARAAGIHLIVATQRPSVDVVTGLIKANIPSRIAFMVSSQVDSRTILDMAGAEKLVGNGDMLFKPQNLDKPIRVQGPFISDEEVENIIEFIKSQNLQVDYDQEVIKEIKNKNTDEKNQADSEDVLMEDAIRTVIKAKQASVSMLQRRFRIGYNRAARIVDDMEMAGIVGPQDGSRPRTVLVDESYFDQKTENESIVEDENTVPEINIAENIEGTENLVNGDTSETSESN